MHLASLLLSHTKQWVFTGGVELGGYVLYKKSAIRNLPSTKQAHEIQDSTLRSMHVYLGIFIYYAKHLMNNKLEKYILLIININNLMNY